MRQKQANIIFTKDLANLYGKELIALDGSSYPVNLDYYEVEITQYIGPFVTVRHKHIRGGSSKIVVPKEFVHAVTLPYGIDLFKPILDTYHPDGWAVISDWLYLYYPKLHITNTIGIEHEIYDLVVRIPINERTGALTGVPEGRRYSFQSTELNSGYAHSHLLHVGQFDLFCLGSSDKGFGKFLRDSQKEAFTEEEFEFFLMQMKAFLEWESIEGTPYHLLADLGINRNFNGYSPELYEDEDPDNEVYTAELDETYIPDVVLEVLKYLKNNRSTLIDMGDTIVFDPSLDSKAFLEFEKSLITRYQEHLGHHMVNWSDERQTYVAGTPGSGGNLPHTSSLDRDLITRFNITPRIIETNNPTLGENVETRFSRNFMREVTRLVNEKLLQSVYTHNHHATRISLKETSNSSVNSTTSSPNPIFA